MNKFLNPLNNMKAGRAKAKAYADGGEVNMWGVTPEETFVGKLMAQRKANAGKSVKERLSTPITMDDPAFGFAGTTVGKIGKGVAGKILQKVGKSGLPMDEASRMARADKDYPMDLYHATSGPVVGGALKEGKTYDSFGIHFGTPETANNRFLVKANELSRDANRPITMNSPNIIPSRVRINNPLRLSENRTGRWGPSDVLMETISAAERGEVPKVTAKEIDDFYNDNLKHKGKKFANLESPELNKVLTNWLESKGYDGIVYKNTVEGGGDSYIAFRGNQTRSRFAKFDPADVESSDLGKASGGAVRKASGGAVHQRALGAKLFGR